MAAGRACPVAACAAVLTLLAAVAPLAPAAFAQTESQVTLTRKDTTIVVTLKAQYADGARFIGNDPNCGEGIRQTLLYGPAPGYVDTRVGKDTELRSNVAIVRSTEPGPGAGANGAQAANAAEQQTLELFDGTLTINRAGCIESAERASEPSVTLTQGRTTVKGTRFYLDQGKDTGAMDGPIELERSASGSASALTATADSMSFDTQTRRTTLSGHVMVTSGGRVTTAGTLELDENAGVAVLTGSPARSTKGSDVLQGSTLRYYLDSNDVVVLGDVQGEVQLDVPSQ